MQPTPEDKLAASVFAAGLLLRSVQRKDIVRWADRRIEDLDCAPNWLIELSFSTENELDLLSCLKAIAAGVDPVRTCEAIYALLPDASDLTFEQAEAFAARLYRITYNCLGGDWTRQLLPITNSLAEEFAFLREGYIHTTKETVVASLQHRTIATKQS